MKLGVLIAVLSLTASLGQRTMADQYDTSKRVSFAGTIDAIIMPPGELPVCFVVTIQNSGKSEQWVVAGDTFQALRKAGWRLGPAGQVKPGVTASMSVFLLKPRSTAAQTLDARLRESMPAGISDVAETALKAGRLAQGVEVKLPDGHTLQFGPAK